MVIVYAQSEVDCFIKPHLQINTSRILCHQAAVAPILSMIIILVWEKRSIASGSVGRGLNRK